MTNKTKWTYCIGATGRDAAYALVSMYLLTYVQYTINLTVAQFGAISACMVACLLWDAINDPLMSIIIENAHFKSGKFKPWIAAGAISNAVIIMLLFTVRLEGWAFVVFFGIGYLLWGMTYTMNDIAYWGMLPTFTSDKDQRNSLVSIMSIFICIGQFSVAGIVPTVIAGNAVAAYRTIGLCVGCAFIAFQLLTVFGVTESKRIESSEKISLGGMFRILGRNDQLIITGIATFLFNVGANLLLMFGVNFFYVEYGYSESGNLVFIYTVMYGLGMLVSQALYAPLSKKIKRATLLRCCLIGLLVGYAAFFTYGYLWPRNLIALDAVGFLIFFCQGLFTCLITVMLNNTIEYDQWKHGERRDATISAVRSFAVKLSGAANQGIVALVLIASGIYTISQQVSGLEILVGKGELTSDQALAQADMFLAGVSNAQRLELRIGMILVPVVMMVAAYVILRLKYTLNEEEYDRIVKELSETSSK